MPIGQKLTPDQAMEAALNVAEEGRGMVSPNPVVGCVILDKNMKLIAQAAHLRFGEGHAEVNAIAQIKDPSLLKGASVFVTLEPCAHQGKTGSCAKALAKLPISNLFYGTQDPNPLVAGKGAEILKEAGKSVTLMKHFEKKSKRLAEQFFFHMERGRPFVALKVGVSFDGKMALENGESQWITGDEARLHARQLRSHYDATMIGAGTLMRDNPLLDFRGTPLAEKRENKIVIVDPRGRAAVQFKEKALAKRHRLESIFVLTSREHMKSWAKNNVNPIEWGPSKSAWEKALKSLYEKSVYSIYVEGGSFVFGQLLQHGLVQKIYMYQSPKLVGEGMSWSQLFKNDKLDEAPVLKDWTSQPLGPDRLNIAYM